MEIEMKKNTIIVQILCWWLSSGFYHNTLDDYFSAKALELTKLD
jgi:hypothetical protein